MAGTQLGGLKASKTNKEKYGADFYGRIGAIGGRKGHTGGFYANRELARKCGAVGGRISKRRPRINEKVRKLLAEGHKVYSLALGRVGEVVAVDSHPLFPVSIKPSGGKLTGATTFNSGDAVELQRRDDGWYVVNKPWTQA